MRSEGLAGRGTGEVPDGFAPIVHSARFGELIGPIYEREGAGDLVRAIRVDEKHTNAGRIVHGGALMTFADIVLAQAVIRALEARPVTVRLIGDFLAPVRIGAWLEGRAHLTRHGRALAFAEGVFTVGPQTVMTAAATFSLRRPRGD